MKNNENVFIPMKNIQFHHFFGHLHDFLWEFLMDYDDDDGAYPTYDECLDEIVYNDDIWGNFLSGLQQ
jgi:hypothetical protein